MRRNTGISCIAFMGLLVLCGATQARPPEEPSILFDTTYGRQVQGSTDAVGLWWASSGWKVGQDRPLPRRHGKAVEISLAGNETEAAQLVVRPAKTLAGFRATAGPLTGRNGAVLAPENVEILRVRYLKVQQRTDHWGAPGMWPDPLPPFEAPISLAANKNQPLWIRVHAPKGTPPGDYQGSLSLRAEGYQAELPLLVHVYGFELPDKMSCTTAFGFSVGNVYRYQKIEDPEQKQAVLNKYWADMGAHHISPYHPTPDIDPKVTWVKLSAGEAAHAPEADRALLQEHALTPVFDWTAWDAEMQRVIDAYHFDSFRLGLPGMGGGSVQGFEKGTRERNLAYAAYCRAWQEHLKEKGWLDMAYVYWIDEPIRKDYPFVMAGFEELKQAAPGIRRMLTEQPEPELQGGPNLWCPLISNYRPEKAVDFRKQGDRFWWYVCTVPKIPYCGLFIDHAATDLRVWLWQTWQYGMEGILIWQSNLWTTGTAYPDQPQNPYEDPMSWMEGYGTKAGQKRPWGNGDGRFMYPPEAAADANPVKPVLDGPVDSIRWEMLRDGIEDYEYLSMLQRLAAEKEGLMPKHFKKEVRKLLEVPESISRNVKNFTRDPAPLEKRRDELARAIERMQRLGAR